MAPDIILLSSWFTILPAGDCGGDNITILQRKIHVNMAVVNSMITEETGDFTKQTYDIFVTTVPVTRLNLRSPCWTRLQIIKKITFLTPIKPWKCFAVSLSTTPD